MAPDSGVLAWKIPWTKEPGQATYYGAAESDCFLRTFNFLEC